MIATVVWGANNIYTLRLDDGTEYEHIRLKGKKLAGSEGEHNPLAPGDRVELDVSGDTPRIAARVPRRNTVLRWNRTRRRMQAIAANADRVCVVVCNGKPEYRPAFVDRVLVMCELEGVPAVIVRNKADLPETETARDHLATLRSLGYPIFSTCAVRDDDPGTLELASAVADNVTVFFGQSGVGKSSLVNHLVPGAGLAVGDVSRRYHRGRHTTTLARQVIAAGTDATTVYIDTPGVREYDLFGYTPTEISGGFREFGVYADGCKMSNCSHSHEPNCAVRAAVKRGAIDERRYAAYRRIIEEMEGRIR